MNADAGEMKKKEAGDVNKNRAHLCNRLWCLFLYSTGTAFASVDTSTMIVLKSTDSVALAFDRQ